MDLAQLPRMNLFAAASILSHIGAQDFIALGPHGREQCFQDLVGLERIVSVLDL